MTCISLFRNLSKKRFGFLDSCGLKFSNADNRERERVREIERERERERERESERGGERGREGERGGERGRERREIYIILPL